MRSLRSASHAPVSLLRRATHARWPRDRRLGLNPEAKSVVDDLLAAGKTAEGYALYTYGAIQIWADAVTTAGSTDFDAVVKALDTDNFKTVLGELKFNDKGDVTLPGYVMYEWKDGKYDYITN